MSFSSLRLSENLLFRKILIQTRASETASLTELWMVQHYNIGWKKNYDLSGLGPKFKIQFEDMIIVNSPWIPTLQGRINQAILVQVHFPLMFTFFVSALWTKKNSLHCSCTIQLKNGWYFFSLNLKLSVRIFLHFKNVSSNF